MKCTARSGVTHSHCLPNRAVVSPLCKDWNSEIGINATASRDCWSSPHRIAVHCKMFPHVKTCKVSKQSLLLGSSKRDIKTQRFFALLLLQTIQYITKNKVMETESRELAAVSRGKIKVH